MEDFRPEIVGEMFILQGGVLTIALHRTQATRRLSERASFYQLARWVASHS